MPLQVVRPPREIITARAETEAIVQGFEAGGVDYIVKPFQDDEVLMRVQAHLQINKLTQALTQSSTELRAEISRREMINEREVEHWGIDGFVGESQTIRNSLESIARLQNIESTVLVTGESGTGKELIARAIHHGSPRASGPFIPVNCSAIPTDLAESMLFGHLRGAFTGADRDRPGYFELANGGTLFLDEVGDMSLDIQAKMLRVLEDGHMLPLGSTEEKHVDVRVVAATNVDLEDSIEAGTFRQDLFFRLARFLVRVPPLRERREDIPPNLPFNLKDAEEFLIQRALDQTGGNITATARLLGTNRPRIYKFLESKGEGEPGVDEQ